MEDKAIASLNMAVIAVVTATSVALLAGLLELTVGRVVSLPIYIIVIVPAFVVEPAFTVIPPFSPLQFNAPPETVPSSLTI
jgi:hypothetical protein